MWNKGRKVEVTLLLSSEMLWIWSTFISPGHGSQLVLFISSLFFLLIKFWKMEILQSIFNTVNVRKHVQRMIFFQVFPQSTLFSLLFDTNDIFCKVAYYSNACKYNGTVPFTLNFLGLESKCHCSEIWSTALILLKVMPHEDLYRWGQQKWSLHSECCTNISNTSVQPVDLE